MPIRRLVLAALVVVSVMTVGGAVVRQPGSRPAPAIAVSPSPSATPLSVMDRLAGAAVAGDLDVMTFNLRYAGSSPPNSWVQRRPVLRELLAAERPDLIGTQEGLAPQLDDIENDLGSDYDRIGLGREGADHGEHMAVFFDRTRLRPEKSGNFWLSETPEVPGSISWGSFRVRMVTWVLFSDLATGRRFYAVNTHLDNESEYARRQAARLITARLARFETLPIVLTGDFNSPAGSGSQVYRFLLDNARLTDTWTSAPRRGPDYATIHNYRPLVPGGKRVDWILTSPGVTTSGALMNIYRHGGQWPSDHLPIQARIHLP
ncbi:endonuclease/exonuclease/phosphatase family protein [Actinoplanes sp. NPDC051861]|uniref:endonuclease/exonuclease/phosphatase family protein n=1 Tax=Actinoplanes sp. NPDC051861 TaxID=3155170 RepID=UPI0034485F76